MARRQPYYFGMLDSLLAEAGGVPLDALHRDVDAICRAYEGINPLADRLGIDRPRPRIAGFSYTHVSTLGCEVKFAAGSEPNVIPCIRRPEDIDGLKEPRDYLASGVAPQRLRTLDKLARRRRDAYCHLDTAEGPLTTCALLMGPDFFLLPYEDPHRAHRLIRFVVDSSLNYNKAVAKFYGDPAGPRGVGICDDFAGMFPPEVFAEFVAPYWEDVYSRQQATERHLHSELLREEHLPFLRDLNIAVFDPSADQYVTPELLRARCPVPFTSRIHTWHIRDNDIGALTAMYRRCAACEPYRISFYMSFLSEEEKILGLLQVARDLS